MDPRSLPDDRGWLEIALLELPDEVISFEYNLNLGGVLNNLKLGYRAAFASRSPGDRPEATRPP